MKNASPEGALAKKDRGFLATVERLGNKMPHPVVLFTYLIVVVLVLSLILSAAGVTAVHPTTGELMTVKNMLSVDGLLLILIDFINNFQNFPILGVVLVLGAITGICEKTGLFSTAIKMSVSKMTGNTVVFAVAFVSVLSKQAGDICQILMPVLAAALFYGIGRHPLAGAFCAYAASSAGFAAAIIPGSMEVNLTPITISSAQLLIPDFDLSVLSSYFALTVAGILIAIVTAVVTVKVVEPRLGTYTGTPEGLESSHSIGGQPPGTGCRQKGRHLRADLPGGGGHRLYPLQQLFPQRRGVPGVRLSPYVLPVGAHRPAVLYPRRCVWKSYGTDQKGGGYCLPDV